MEGKANRRLILILGILLMPLFIINVKDSHDWGDDFAQYLLQTENLVHGRPQTETGYIHDERFPVVAPPAYPAGLPLLLAPVYIAFGHSIFHYELLISLCLFLLCLLTGLFLRKYFGTWASILLTLVFAYNQWTLYFMGSILSDIPFALFLLACTLAYVKWNGIKGAIITGCLSGYLVLVRGAGWIFPIAVMAHVIYRQFRGNASADKRKTLLDGILIAGLTAVISFGVNGLLNIPSSGFFGFYGHTVHGNDMISSIGRNIHYYMEVFKAFFQPQMENGKFLAVILAWLALLSLVAGMICTALTKRSFVDIVTAFYILLFILYPYGAGGFRFIMPVMPFLLLYMGRGVKWALHGRIPDRVVLLLATVVLSAWYVDSTLDVWQKRQDIPEGPQRKESLEMLQYIQDHKKPGDVFMFTKPRALSLYARVKTCSTVYTMDAADVKNMCDGLGVTWLLQTEDARDAPMESFLAAYPQRAMLQWQNSRFRLYRLVP